MTPHSTHTMTQTKGEHMKTKKSLFENPNYYQDMATGKFHKIKKPMTHTESWKKSPIYKNHVAYHERYTPMLSCPMCLNIEKYIASETAKAVKEERKELIAGIRRWVGTGATPLHDCEYGKCHTRMIELLDHLQEK